jgi:hypothetical protein
MVIKTVAIYAFFDDILKSMRYQEPVHRKVNDAETATVLLPAAMYFGGRKYNCNEFCISCFTVYRLFMLHRLQNTVKKMRILQRFL